MPRRLAALLALACLVVAGVCVVLLNNGGDELTSKELLAYQGAVAPAVHDGGATVQLGMKPAIQDLVNRHVVPPETIVTEADGWIRDLTAVRTRVAAVKPPSQLRETARLLDKALSEYLAAASLFKTAAATPASVRQQLLQAGYAKAEAADGHYDDASRLLQRLRHQLGLGSTSQFPDPDRTAAER